MPSSRHTETILPFCTGCRPIGSELFWWQRWRYQGFGLDIHTLVAQLTHFQYSDAHTLDQLNKPLSTGPRHRYLPISPDDSREQLMLETPAVDQGVSFLQSTEGVESSTCYPWGWKWEGWQKKLAPELLVYSQKIQIPYPNTLHSMQV